MEIGLPDARAWPLLGRRNLQNALLVLLVPLPGVLATWWLFHCFAPGPTPPDPGWAAVWEAWLLHHPILCLNLFYLVFCNLIFWGIALVQRSSWLIDPYWTLLQLLIAGFYAAHPLAEPNVVRAGLTWTSLVVWSVRLTCN